MHDINDKEIYVGDILKFGGHTHTVDDIVHFHIWAYQNSMDNGNLEIIGNIYETIGQS